MFSYLCLSTTGMKERDRNPYKIGICAEYGRNNDPVDTLWLL